LQAQGAFDPFTMTLREKRLSLAKDNTRPERFDIGGLGRKPAISAAQA
jgi:hypothetical protein